MAFPVFQFALIALPPATGQHWEESGSVFFTPPHQIFIYTEKIPLSILSSQGSPSTWQMLQVLHHLHGPLLDSLQHVHLSLVLRSPGLDTNLQMCLTSAEQRTKIISPDLLATPFLMQSRELMAFLAARAHCWLTDTVLSTQLFDNKQIPWHTNCIFPCPSCNSYHHLSQRSCVHFKQNDVLYFSKHILLHVEPYGTLYSFLN